MDTPHENERWGLYAEWTVRGVCGLEKDRAGCHDARDEYGNPWEVKACKRRTGSRGDLGKYFIRWENHQELRERGGYYAFVVYDPGIWKRGPVLAVEMKPAEWLDEVDTYAWTDNGSRRGETVFRPPWTAVFEREDIAGEGVADADPVEV